MSEPMTIQVNFGRPMPVFPLNTVTLLPQQVLPMHIFEPRYKQMVDHVLDGAGQIAMAVFEGDQWRHEYHGRPAIRAAVCVGQIIQHEGLPDGRYNILLQGVCRAKVRQELPAEEDKLYREAVLEPVGMSQSDEDLYGVRESLANMLSEEPLTDLSAAEAITEHIRNDAIPVTAVMELVSFTILTDPEVKYRLLAEGDAGVRAELIEDELRHIRALLVRAEGQREVDLPRGCTWN